MEENNGAERQEIFSERVRAGKRTYFFDVKATRSNDYYLTITESKRRYKDDGYSYEKHKIFLYKEDFDKFVNALNNTVNHVKDELMPEVDFSQFEKSSVEFESAPASVTDPSPEAETPATEEAVAEAPEDTTPTEETETVEAEAQDEESGIDSELKWE